MPARLDFDDYISALRTAAARLSDETAGPPDDRPVPTCPDWTTRDLLAHTGMVHRWAAGIVRGELNSGNSEEATTRFEAAGRAADDAGAWLLTGATDLADELTAAPDDLQRFFFLNDAPPPKLAWARRQCHETTIHAVDGLSARLGRMPTAAEADLDAQVAVDGIDELLRGFATRRSEKLILESPLTVVIETADTGCSWTLVLSDGPATCDEGVTSQHPDARLSGTAAQVYLGLWNRGDELAQDGVDALALWRDKMHVEWG
ncbi:maleylpyruvate isomerase family mycothiol-dependent enzyme [Flexivirga oryzae]|uniref:Uncharacterized protein (TIGR03083 family) n=1 Tax=Flexivirga oryzae TaxID=1794944 RepID=A0A839N807_9MICO|nr:maleylpyruvate isomerase family mycothiol-dependent enzyme [Flexivirga oryzae]MBB2890881.1 uncharacterized protein (TIGR03083 family) [Flexivirga oryzae]